MPSSDSTAQVAAAAPEVSRTAPWLRRIPLRSPTLPPAEHTNAYVIGDGPLLVCDPGTPDRGENDRLLAELATLGRQGQAVQAIFLTHHHHDHVSGAAYLQQQLRVPIWAHQKTAQKLGPKQLSVDRLVGDGERLPFGPGGYAVHHTPGHAPGHLCLVDGHSPDAIVGDMVASVGTILVSPADDGDMAAYLDSLRRLTQLATARQLRLWPAHGASVEKGAELLEFYLWHRLEREAKVVAALGLKPASLDALLPQVYADKPDVHPWLGRESLLAHLHKLASDGRAVLDAATGGWALLR